MHATELQALGPVSGIGADLEVGDNGNKPAMAVVWHHQGLGSGPPIPY